MRKCLGVESFPEMSTLTQYKDNFKESMLSMSLGAESLKKIRKSARCAFRD